MRWTVLLALSLLVGCGNKERSSEVVDAGPTVRPWERFATPMSALPVVRGLRPVRGIIHSHSPFSHDACDGAGLDDAGKPKAACVAEMRRGMCEAAEDFVFLTDHAAHMAEQTFDDLFFVGPTDKPVTDGAGAKIANRVDCMNGRSVLVMVGNENHLISAGLERHLPGDAAARLAAYDGDDAATVTAMHDAGALVIIPHTEQRADDYLAAMPFDGMEIYNLHAAMDPKIRPAYLGLDGYAAAVNLLAFVTNPDLQPDLAVLAFYQELPLYRTKWDKLLPNRHVTGTVGTDVHQNTFPGQAADGERGDSYRRLMRWFSNVLLVSGELDPANAKKTLAKGRGYVAVEVLGLPTGFDFHAESGATTFEMGDEAPKGATIVAKAPTVFGLDPAAQAPAIRMRLLRVTAAGSTTVSEGTSITLPNAEPGAYRVEVFITPHHLRGYLGELPDKYVKEGPWLFSNPLYVR